MVWYFHLFKNFPQIVVLHIVKDFNLVNEAEVDVFLELSCFFNDQSISGSSAFPKSSLNIWKFMAHLLLKPGLENFEHHCARCAAAAKSLQSCPTLREPVDCSLPGSSVHGIFQARVLEWVAIAFSGCPLWATAKTV